MDKFGYSADAVSNGKEVISALRVNDYDLVLMDVQMPEMDGFEATKLIRDPASGVKNNSVPIIAMTAHAMEGDRHKCLKAGMDDYISKPLDPQKMLNKIRIWTAKGDIDDTDQDSMRKDVPGKRESEPPIYYNEALQKAMGDKEFLLELLDYFMESSEDTLRSLDKNMKGGDIEAFTMEAHSLKGAAANLSAHKIATLARTLESMGRTGKIKEADERLQELYVEFGDLKNYCNNLDQFSSP